MAGSQAWPQSMCHLKYTDRDRGDSLSMIRSRRMKCVLGLGSDIFHQIILFANCPLPLANPETAGSVGVGTTLQSTDFNSENYEMERNYTLRRPSHANTQTGRRFETSSRVSHDDVRAASTKTHECENKMRCVGSVKRMGMKSVEGIELQVV